MIVACPCGCDTEFRVTVTPVIRRAIPGSPLNESTLAAVLEFMRHHGPGRAPVAELYAAFIAWTATGAGTGGRGLTRAAFVRALRRNGAVPWRTMTTRGYEIPRLNQEEPAEREETPEDRAEREKSFAAFLGLPTDCPV